MLLSNSAFLAEHKPDFPIKCFLRQTNTKLDKHKVCGAYIAVFVYNLGKSVQSQLQRCFFPKRCHFPNIGQILTV